MYNQVAEPHTPPPRPFLLLFQTYGWKKKGSRKRCEWEKSDGADDEWKHWWVFFIINICPVRKKEAGGAPALPLPVRSKQPESYCLILPFPVELFADEKRDARSLAPLAAPFPRFPAWERERTRQRRTTF